MACKSCSSSKWSVNICRCCELVDLDTKKKRLRFVKYAEFIYAKNVTHLR